MKPKEFWQAALSIADEATFNRLALELFHYQSENVGVYRKFLQHLKFHPAKVRSISEIPFLPVQLFKSMQVTDHQKSPDFYFSSSGTTEQVPSRHYISDLSIYDESLMHGFRYFYGDPSKYCIFALLPSYLERSGSSLVYMVDSLMKSGNHPESGFYLHNLDELSLKLSKFNDRNVTILLLGVTYALLDLFEQYPVRIPHAVIMETGGMKGRRKEMIRPELHQKLSELSGAGVIHSEYGMTELLSQAYSRESGLFKCPPWMKVFMHDLHDPFCALPNMETGMVNIIDLANIHSCAFISTHDLGRRLPDGQFEILGRADNSELRGCNLMIG